MKKLFLGLGLCLSLSLVAQQPPVKAAVIAKAPAKPGTKVEEAKKVDETSMFEDVKLLYKSTETGRTKIKNHAKAQYNTITNSDSFQLGKCVVGGLLVYYGVKQLQSFTATTVNADVNMQIGIANPFNEVRPQVIYKFLKNRENFKEWLKNPVTKAGMKIVVGALLLKKPIFSLTAAYEKAAKKFL